MDPSPSFSTALVHTQGTERLLGGSSVLDTPPVQRHVDCSRWFGMNSAIEWILTFFPLLETRKSTCLVQGERHSALLHMILSIWPANQNGYQKLDLCPCLPKGVRGREKEGERERIMPVGEQHTIFLILPLAQYCSVLSLMYRACYPFFPWPQCSCPHEDHWYNRLSMIAHFTAF